MTRFDSTIARLSFLKAKLCERAPPSVANLLAFADNERAAERLHALASAYEAEASDENAQRQIVPSRS